MRLPEEIARLSKGGTVAEIAGAVIDDLGLAYDAVRARLDEIGDWTARYHRLATATEAFIFLRSS